MIPVLQLIDYTKIKKNQMTQNRMKKDIEDYKKCTDSKNKDYMSTECIILKHKMENIMMFNAPR